MSLGTQLLIRRLLAREILGNVTGFFPDIAEVLLDDPDPVVESNLTLLAGNWHCSDCGANGTTEPTDSHKLAQALTPDFCEVCDSPNIQVSVGAHQANGRLEYYLVTKKLAADLSLRGELVVDSVHPDCMVWERDNPEGLSLEESEVLAAIAQREFELVRSRLMADAKAMLAAPDAAEKVAVLLFS